MKLETILRNEGYQIQKLLIPKNGGLMGYRDVALERVGVDKFKDLEITERRGEDIPKLCDKYTEIGIPVFGLTGDDFYDEYKLRNPDSELRVVNTIDWYDEKAKFGRPTLCLLGREKDSLDALPNGPIAINEKYIYTINQYLDELENEIRRKLGKRETYRGGLEENVKKDLERLCIDIVYEGKTIEENNLKVLYIIRQSDIILITSWPKSENALAKDYGRIKNRKVNPTNSYTSKLLQNPNKIIKKIGEEVAEFIADYSKKNKKGIIGEAADVIYAIQTALVDLGINWNEIEKEIYKRQKNINTNNKR